MHKMHLKCLTYLYDDCHLFIYRASLSANIYSIESVLRIGQLRLKWRQKLDHSIPFLDSCDLLAWIKWSKMKTRINQFSCCKHFTVYSEHICKIDHFILAKTYICLILRRIPRLGNQMPSVRVEVAHLKSWSLIVDLAL